MLVAWAGGLGLRHEPCGLLLPPRGACSGGLPGSERRGHVELEDLRLVVLLLDHGHADIHRDLGDWQAQAPADADRRPELGGVQHILAERAHIGKKHTGDVVGEAVAEFVLEDQLGGAARGEILAVGVMRPCPGKLEAPKVARARP